MIRSWKSTVLGAVLILGGVAVLIWADLSMEAKGLIATGLFGSGALGVMYRRQSSVDRRKG